MFLFPVPYPAQFPFPDYFSDKVGLEERTHPLITTPERAEVRTWLKIPEGVRVQLRQDVEVKNEVASFETHYTLTEEGEILVVRVLQIDTDELSPEAYPLYKEVISSLLEDAQAIVLLMP